MIGQSIIKDAENTIGAMKEAGYNIKLPDPIGQLVHEPTMSRICLQTHLPIQAAYAPLVLRGEI